MMLLQDLETMRQIHQPLASMVQANHIACNAQSLVFKFPLRRLRVRYLDLLVLEWNEDLPMEEALIACETMLPVGTRGHIRAGLAAQPFASEVAVRRHHPRQSPKGYTSLGAMFGGMDDRSRKSLESFLPKGKH